MAAGKIFNRGWNEGMNATYIIMNNTYTNLYSLDITSC